MVKVDPYGRGKDFQHDKLAEDLVNGVRVCTKCNERKSLNDFSQRKDHPTGYKGQCKQCDAADFSRWRTTNIDKALQIDRAKHYHRKYGVSKELSLFLSDEKNRIGDCPICGNVAKLVMDHDHKTGKVREMICSHCNTLIGYARENIGTLYEAIAYLKKHKGV